MKTWYQIRLAAVSCLSLSCLLIVGCKLPDFQSKSALKSEGDDVAVRIMLNDNDLRYIDNKSMEAVLVCESAKDRYTSRFPARGIGGLRGVSFRTGQDIQPGTLCHVEIYGELDERFQSSIRLEWLTQNREANLLFVSRSAPAQTSPNDPIGLGRGSLSSLFYKTFEARPLDDEVEMDVSEMISENAEETEKVDI